MIEINGKVYRNLQEQVLENTKDIADLQEGGGITINAYTKEESDAKFQTIAGMSDYATDTELTNGLATKQDTLVSGTSIKTINGNTLLGSGDIIIGEGGTTISGGTGINVSADGEISIDDTVALKSELFSGDYDDLTDKPDLSIYAESSDLATVATTGDYDDLLNKPSYDISNVVTDQGDVLGIQLSDGSLTYNVNNVEANPTLAGTESDLTSIQIGSYNYKIPTGGSGSSFDMTYNGNSIATNDEVVIEVSNSHSSSRPLATISSSYPYLKLGKLDINFSITQRLYCYRCESYKSGGGSISSPSWNATIYLLKASDPGSLTWSQLFAALPVGNTPAVGQLSTGSTVYNIEYIHKALSTSTSIQLVMHEIKTSGNVASTHYSTSIDKTDSNITVSTTY